MLRQLFPHLGSKHLVPSEQGVGSFGWAIHLILKNRILLQSFLYPTLCFSSYLQNLRIKEHSFPLLLQVRPHVRYDWTRTWEPRYGKRPPQATVSSDIAPGPQSHLLRRYDWRPRVHHIPSNHPRHLAGPTATSRSLNHGRTTRRENDAEQNRCLEYNTFQPLSQQEKKPTISIYIYMTYIYITLKKHSSGFVLVLRWPRRPV